MANIDDDVVAGFGEEWSRYDQSGVSREELKTVFDAYFSVFPWESLTKNAVGFDLGCGTGRWAGLVAPHVGILHCIDPSHKALDMAKKNLQEFSNCRFHLASVDEIPLPDESADFGYSIGVLHHTPDPMAALNACTAKLKPGSPFLVYLYYAFDNRPIWFRAIWRLSDFLRRVISRMPYSWRYAASQAVAAFVYLPMSRFALFLEKSGAKIDSFPLSYYRHSSFYIMRNDSLDRFGTMLEHRFTQTEIRKMMAEAGLEDIRFREAPPYWCAAGIKKCAE
ncbi:MAG: methyltransferase domain-containing protein [Thermodesulfobacteriota bacterium]|nr:methyltransferase domain-containing protein [Thermodesulfobacteriota bacterium]